MINKIIQKLLLAKTNLFYFFWFQKRSATKKVFPTFKYTPLISVIVPVYNPPEIYFRKCIDSVLNQTYQNWELCLVDDCSPNANIRQIITDYAAKDKRIKYSFRQVNGHISNSSNDAIALSTGEFISLLDHDDEITPHALSSVVNVLNQFPKTDFIYSDEDKLSMQGIHCDPSFKSDFAMDRLLSNNYICHLSTIRKSLVDKIGGFRVGYEGSQDFDLILRIVEITKNTVHIPDILYHWRKIPNSTAAVYSVKSYANQASINTLVDYLKRNKIKGEVENGLKLGTFKINYKILGNPLVSIITKSTQNLNLLTYKNFEVVDNVNNAKGEYYLFLDKNIKITTPDFIQNLLQHAQRSEIGQVGCKILYRNGTIFNSNFHGLPDTISQPFPNLNAKDIITNPDSISTECFMVARNKVNKPVYRTLYTPYAISVYQG